MTLPSARPPEQHSRCGSRQIAPRTRITSVFAILGEHDRIFDDQTRNFVEVTAHMLVSCRPQMRAPPTRGDSDGPRGRGLRAWHAQSLQIARRRGAARSGPVVPGLDRCEDRALKPDPNRRPRADAGNRIYAPNYPTDAELSGLSTRSICHSANCSRQRSPAFCAAWSRTGQSLAPGCAPTRRR